MTIKTHRNFDKNFKKRIARSIALKQQFKKRLALFIQNSHNPILRDHRLVGAKKELRSFSITGDIRVVYQRRSENEVVLLDIGTHNQVY